MGVASVRCFRSLTTRSPPVLSGYMLRAKQDGAKSVMGTQPTSFVAETYLLADNGNTEIEASHPISARDFETAKREANEWVASEQQDTRRATHVRLRKEGRIIWSRRLTGYF